MENLDKKQCEGMCCGSSCHGGYCGGKHHLIKIILKLIIVAMIFCFGFRLGVITGSLGGWHDRDNGYGMMRGYGYFQNNLPPVNPTGAVVVPPKQ